MKIGLIGLSGSGKTTLFHLLTQTDETKSGSKKFETSVGIAKIPDPRIDFLSGIYNPKKSIFATIEVIDVPGITPSETSSKSSSLNQFLESVRTVDCLVQIVRVFASESELNESTTVDPLSDMETVHMELLFADLAVIENRIGRIQSGKKMNSDIQTELEVLKKCMHGLENQMSIHSLGLSDEEKKYIKTFDFLTERPEIIVINLDENQYTSGMYPQKEQISSYAQKQGTLVIGICAKTELEISKLEEDDRKVFLEDIGISETGISKLSNAAYKHLGLISFLTVGEDEVRAWPIHKGISAKAAGGKIHSDIERGFIRAETVKYSDFYTLGSMAKIKEKGLFKLEGKEYIIEDGDIINFRFNV